MLGTTPSRVQEILLCSGFTPDRAWSILCVCVCEPYVVLEMTLGLASCMTSPLRLYDLTSPNLFLFFILEIGLKLSGTFTLTFLLPHFHRSEQMLLEFHAY